VKITGAVLGPFQENTWLLTDDDEGEAVLIDPGDRDPRLVRLVEESGAKLRAIWVTHGHLDHIGGIAEVRRHWDAEIFLHPADLVLYGEGAIRAAAAYGIPFEPPPPPERSFAEGDRLVLGGLTFDVWHVPGHSPGHVMIHGHGIAFGGDCLFAGSIGRTDLPLSDPAAMRSTLARLTTLPPDTRVYPGHGPTTTIAEELASNPFLSGIARPVIR
jgi:glyoxylase-like metal-dependent hydrolase (beta-lactamase superfamily II)